MSPGRSIQERVAEAAERQGMSVTSHQAPGLVTIRCRTPGCEYGGPGFGSDTVSAWLAGGCPCPLCALRRTEQ